MKIGYFSTVAIEAALAAGEFLKSLYRKEIETKYKGDRNPVTFADLQSQKIIKEIISKNFKNPVFLAEEEFNESNIDYYKNYEDYLWIIDPLDGTVNFRKGFPFFCVSIALQYKKEIILGVIYNPILNELFIAEKGSGAYLNDERIFVSKTNELKKSVLATGFSYALVSNPEPHITFFKELSIRTEAVRRAGSAAIDLAYVAAGIFDGFWEFDLNPWDTAAGYLLVLEANGKVTTYKNQNYFIYDKTIVASNGLIHDYMINILKDYQ
ncbi:MAG: inositol monophosphatase family protein [bacterium]|jgi:myo-inositol-1(or 4)-monophosphatase